MLVTNLSYTAATRARQLLALNERLSHWWQAQGESERFPLLEALPQAWLSESTHGVQAPHPWWGKARLSELALTPRKRLLLRRHETSLEGTSAAVSPAAGARDQAQASGAPASHAQHLGHARGSDDALQALKRQARTDTTARKLYEMASKLPPGRPSGGLRSLLTPSDAAASTSSPSESPTPGGPTEPLDE